MELWIRSQDKGGLILCQDIYCQDITETIKKEGKFIRPEKYGDYNTHTEEFEEEKYLYTIIKNNNRKLGIYKTRERALEVLDEIQEVMWERSQVSNWTYEMPSE